MSLCIYRTQFWRTLLRIKMRNPRLIVSFQQNSCLNITIFWLKVWQDELLQLSLVRTLWRPVLLEAQPSKWPESLLYRMPISLQTKNPNKFEKIISLCVLFVIETIWRKDKIIWLCWITLPFMKSNLFHDLKNVRTRRMMLCNSIFIQTPHLSINRNTESVNKNLKQVTYTIRTKIH
jgi:hypothetical protein